MNRFVVSMWLAAAAIYCFGVFVLVQNSISAADPYADGALTLRDHRQVQRVLASDEAQTGARLQLASAETASPTADRAQSAAGNTQSQTMQANADQPKTPPLPPRKPDGPEPYVTVAGEDAVMRPEPNKAAPMLFAFPVGRKLDVISQTDGWTEAKDPASQATGWIASDQLAKPGQQIAALEQPQNLAENDAPSGVPDWRDHVGRRNGPIASFFRHAFGR